MKEVLAPMPGFILDVLVGVGDTVLEEQNLIILEAMKMENPVMAPCDGTVKEIKVQKGDKVASDQVLMMLEPE